jgi:hypothetical protein
MRFVTCCNAFFKTRVRNRSAGHLASRLVVLKNAAPRGEVAITILVALSRAGPYMGASSRTRSVKSPHGSIRWPDDLAFDRGGSTGA